MEFLDNIWTSVKITSLIILAILFYINMVVSFVFTIALTISYINGEPVELILIFKMFTVFFITVLISVYLWLCD